MPEKHDERIKLWRQRWESDPSRVTDIITCLREKSFPETSRRIARLSWYTQSNGFMPLTFSSDRSRLILDLRGIPLRNADLKDVILPFTLLDGADFYKANLQNADLSFVRAHGASFHQADMKNVKLVAARLEGADLSMAVLASADLSRAHLEGADLGWSDLTDATLVSASLEGATMEKMKAERGDFSDAKLSRVNLSMSLCKEAVFTNARLQGARLVAAHLERANFVGANLEDADLSLAYMERSYLNFSALKRADLTRAHLEGADLGEANLSGANLFAVHFEGAGLRKTSLNKANLKAARLEQTDLRQADLRGSNLSEASLLRANLEGADLREADLGRSQFRLPGFSASIDEETRFGWKAQKEEKARLERDSFRWLLPPLSRIDKSARKSFPVKTARHLCNQIRMLYRDNGLFHLAGSYFEQENYWLTRYYKARGASWTYLIRLILFEWFTGYGEKPLRIVTTGGMLILLFAFLYLFSGVTTSGYAINYDLASGFMSFGVFIQDFWTCLLFSVQCFVTLGLGSILPISGFSQTLASLEGLLGVFGIMLGVVTFVRKAVRE